MFRNPFDSRRALTLLGGGGAVIALALLGVSCAPRGVAVLGTPAPLVDAGPQFGSPSGGPSGGPVVMASLPALPAAPVLAADELPALPRTLPRLVVVRDAPPPRQMARAADPAPLPAPGMTAPAAFAQAPADTAPDLRTQTTTAALAALATVPPRPRPARLTAPVVAAPVTAPVAELAAELAAGPGLARSALPRPRPAGLVLASLTQPATPSRPVIPAVPDAPAPPLASLIPAPTAPLLAPQTLTADSCANALSRTVPRRPGRAAGGQAVLAGMGDLHGSPRDRAIEDQIAAGNIPDFLRNLVPVTVTEGGNRLTFCVMPDYLAVGSNADFVRTPLGLPAAMRIADRFDMLLPTARMVDQIHAQARLRLTPQPMTPGPQMESTAYLLRHNATLEQQRGTAPLGVLVSGHKKDVVLTNRLQSAPGRVAIYGWHQANGRPIQPLSTVHGANYADYSHGIRLVARTAFLNGRPVDLRELLGDARLAGLVSGEGPLTTRLTLAALR